MDNNELLMIVLAFVLGYMLPGMLKNMCGQRLVEGNKYFKNAAVRAHNALQALHARNNTIAGVGTPTSPTEDDNTLLTSENSDITYGDTNGQSCSKDYECDFHVPGRTARCPGECKATGWLGILPPYKCHNTLSCS